MENLLTCLCAICTDRGRRPSGSSQSRTVRAQHIRAEEARRITYDPVVENTESSLEEDILLATLSAEEDCRGEDPLWRGWRGSSELADARIYEREVASRESKVDETMNFEKSREAIVQSFQERNNAFLPPQQLHFTFPPTSPTAAYPGPGPWDMGPTSLRQTVLSNALIMLHYTFLIHTQQALEITDPGQSIELEQVHDALNKLEVFREGEWTRQQRATPDIEKLRSNSEALGAKVFNTGKWQWKFP
jgi:hypothetical protein